MIELLMAPFKKQLAFDHFAEFYLKIMAGALLNENKFLDQEFVESISKLTDETIQATLKLFVEYIEKSNAIMELKEKKDAGEDVKSQMN